MPLFGCRRRARPITRWIATIILMRLAKTRERRSLVTGVLHFQMSVVSGCMRHDATASPLLLHMFHVCHTIGAWTKTRSNARYTLSVKTSITELEATPGKIFACPRHILLNRTRTRVHLILCGSRKLESLPFAAANKRTDAPLTAPRPLHHNHET